MDQYPVYSKLRFRITSQLRNDPMNMDKIKQSIGPGIWGAVIGAAGLAIVGFNWSGWMIAKTADEMSGPKGTMRVFQPT